MMKKRKDGCYLSDLYKQTRDSRPFNIIKYIVCTVISMIYAIGIYFIFNFMCINMIKNKNGDIYSYYEISFNVYFSIIFIHFFMIYIDTSLYNYVVIVFFAVQFCANFLFVISFDKINFDNNKLSGVLREILHLDTSFLSVIIACVIGCFPFYTLVYRLSRQNMPKFRFPSCRQCAGMSLR